MEGAVVEASDLITVDTETLAITDDIAWDAPRPVGVSVKDGCRPSHYYGWGHPEGNNCRFEDAVHVLREVWASGRPLLFHHAGFDLKVIAQHMGLPVPDWRRIHDTQFLHFLVDPHARKAGLKPLAEQRLNWPPEEQDDLNDWLWSRKARLEAETGDRITKSKLGAYIAYAPGDLVGKYACGDTDRTFALFEDMYPIVAKWGMLKAYARERQILPIFMENERVGIRMDLEGLERDIAAYSQAFEYVEAWLRARLGNSGLNLDADREVAEALSNAGAVPDDAWVMTKSGQRSVSKDNLHPDMFTDQAVASALGYRNRLKTCLTMFMEPWQRQAARRGGFVSTSWNQVRNPEGGTRTGRPSTSNPNFLNISKDFEGRSDGYRHPDHLDLPSLPLVRKYVLPDGGHTFLHRDFSGQELRVFAHFEQADLYEGYARDAAMDPHALVGGKMSELMGQSFERGKVKILNFQSLYGGGIPALMGQLRCSQDQAREFKRFHDAALPGRKKLVDAIAAVVRSGEPIRTWGGRCYLAEEPSFSKKHNRWMAWDYKLINYAIQGSAADLTKQSIIDWHNHPDRDPSTRFLVSVYDENNISAPTDIAKQQMRVLKESMEADRLTVPMLSDGKMGPTWGDLVKCE